MPSEPESLLLITVGGSHEPILQAIQHSGADLICFICSRNDIATGQKGSCVQIEGKGNVIKTYPDGETPPLPNIPTQLNLSNEQWQRLAISPDDFDDIYSTIMDFMQQQPTGIRMLADYTGGTKTMSAALVAAALDHGGVELQLVSGPRDSLRVVGTGGTVMPASVEKSRFQRAFRSALEPWSGFAYEEAAQRLAKVPVPGDTALRAELQRALSISSAFAEWDRFQHHGANDRLSGFRPVLGPVIADHLNVLGLLCNPDVPAREILQIYDLWRNAQRRAAQQRYDDAVARLYRVLEWSAQWLLQTQADIQTSNVPRDKIPPGITLSENREGTCQAGLYQAWQLAAHHCEDRVGTFWSEEKETLLDRLSHRNHSILAHGFEPVGEKGCRDFSNWVEDRLLPLLLSFSASQPWRIRNLPSQLPTDYQQMLSPRDRK